MLTYNNHLKQLVLPEYGRNIQNMVDHCLTIEDRQERTACAYSIVNAMATARSRHPSLMHLTKAPHRCLPSDRARCLTAITDILFPAL